MLPLMIEGESLGSIYDRKDQPVPALKPGSMPALRNSSHIAEPPPRQTRLSTRSGDRRSTPRRGDRRPSGSLRHNVTLFWGLLAGLLVVVGLVVYHAWRSPLGWGSPVKASDLRGPLPMGTSPVSRQPMQPIQPIKVP